MSFPFKTLSTIALSLALIACDSDKSQQSNKQPAATKEQNEEVQERTTFTNTTTTLPIIKHFDQDSIIGSPKIVDCTLSAGTKTSCISITIKPQPANMKIGPWCPRNITDGPEKSGIWFEGSNVYDADGAFISNLAEFYKDDAWQLFDQETGAINVTDSEISCAAAAQPVVEEKYNNYCVECSVSYMDSDAAKTYIIPIEPAIPQDKTTKIRQAGVGLAYSGALIDGSAPTQAILNAHTLAPFDDCGGHVNLHDGYHIHAITDKKNCLKEVSDTEGHASAIGLAMDGHTIYKQPLSNKIELDQCGGHESASQGYHYHAAAPGKNQIITCHTGEIGCSLDDPSSSCDATQQKRPGGGPPAKNSRRDSPPIE